MPARPSRLVLALTLATGVSPGAAHGDSLRAERVDRVSIALELTDGRVLRVGPASAPSGAEGARHVARLTRARRALGEAPAVVALEGDTLHVLTCARAAVEAPPTTPGATGGDAPLSRRDVLRAVERDPEYEALRGADPACFGANPLEANPLPDESRMECLREHGPALARIVARVFEAQSAAREPPRDATPVDPICGRAQLAVRTGRALDGFFQPGRFRPDWTSYEPAGPTIGAKGSWRYSPARP